MQMVSLSLLTPKAEKVGEGRYVSQLRNIETLQSPKYYKCGWHSHLPFRAKVFIWTSWLVDFSEVNLNEVNEDQGEVPTSFASFQEMHFSS